jgi:hypothetical protein
VYVIVLIVDHKLQEIKMSSPAYTLIKAVKIGIWDNSQYVARVYADKIILVSPYVKWVGSTGGYAERRLAIRDMVVVSAVLLDIEDGAEDSAWAIIGRAINDEFLMHAGA